MTPARLREVLGLLHWSQRGLADILACDERQVRRWASGATEIPAVVATWLEGLADAMVRMPAPGNWRQRKRTA